MKPFQNEFHIISFAQTLQYIFKRSVPENQTSVLPTCFHVYIDFFHNDLFPHYIINNLLPRHHHYIIPPAVIHIGETDFTRNQSGLYRPAPFVSLYVELRSMYHYLGIVQRADNELLSSLRQKECFTHQLHFPFIIGKPGRIAQRRRRVQNDFRSIRQFDRSSHSRICPDFHHMYLFFILVPIKDRPRYHQRDE